MMKWVMEMVRGPMGETTERGASKKPQLSRREMSELFSDDLARPVLQKRTKVKRDQPRRLMAGRQIQFA